MFYFLLLSKKRKTFSEVHLFKAACGLLFSVSFQKRGVYLKKGHLEMINEVFVCVHKFLKNFHLTFQASVSIPDTTAATHLPGQVSPIESNAGIALKSSQFNDYDNLPSNISKKTIKTQDSVHSDTISKNTLIEDKQNESPAKKRSAEYDNITLGKESGEKFTIFLGKYNFVESETRPILLDINALSISFFNLALFSAILFEFYGTCCLLIFILVTFHYITVLEIWQKPSLSSQCRSHGRDISFSQHFSLNIIVSGPFLGEEE